MFKNLLFLFYGEFYYITCTNNTFSNLNKRLFNDQGVLLSAWVCWMSAKSEQIPGVNHLVPRVFCYQ